MTPESDLFALKFIEAFFSDSNKLGMMILQLLDMIPLKVIFTAKFKIQKLLSQVNIHCFISESLLCEALRVK